MFLLIFSPLNHYLTRKKNAKIYVMINSNINANSTETEMVIIHYEIAEITIIITKAPFGENILVAFCS